MSGEQAIHFSKGGSCLPRMGRVLNWVVHYARKRGVWSTKYWNGAYVAKLWNGILSDIEKFLVTSFLVYVGVLAKIYL